jgi:hypothetical protein
MKFVVFIIIFDFCLMKNSFLEYDYVEKIERWNLKLASGYRDMAGLGYITNSSMTEQLKILRNVAEPKINKNLSQLVNRIFNVLGWEHIQTSTFDDFHSHSYTILRNLNLKKVICTFSGTTGIRQTISEILHSKGRSYFRDPCSKIEIMEYFHELYKRIQCDFSKNFEKAKNEKITQYIFVGHSLGGAIASIALLDLSKQFKLTLDKINKSPVLITYGQPRTGNYAFSNELFKFASIIYRHVNEYDLVPGIPSCEKRYGLCINEFYKQSMNISENYEQVWEKGTSFFPWHSNGLILINGNSKNIYNICLDQSENPKKECELNTSLNFDFHRYYFGYKVSDLWKPEIYNTSMENYDYCAIESQKIKLFNPSTDVWKEEKKEKSKFFTRYFKDPLCKSFTWAGKKMNWISKKLR